MESAVFLGYQSALEYLCRERYFDASGTGTWNSDKNLPAIPPAERTVTVRSLPDKLPSDDHITALLDGPLRGLSTPVHVLVPQRVLCGHSKLKTAHLLTQQPLSYSFQQISSGVFCASPEFCFIQMVRLLPFVELARLANELCGTYVLAPYEEDGFRNCRPLTSCLYLKASISRAIKHHVRWSQQAQRVMPFIGDRSASPMETVIALLLALPYRYGGYAIKFPSFNEEFNKGESSKTAPSYRCDLLWKEYRIAIEYEGEAFHTGIERIEHDADRCNELIRRGLQVIRVTKRQLYSVQKFDQIARHVMASLNKQPHMDECKYNWISRQDLLCARLLPNNNELCNERIGRTSTQSFKELNALKNKFSA